MDDNHYHCIIQSGLIAFTRPATDKEDGIYMTLNPPTNATELPYYFYSHYLKL